MVGLKRLSCLGEERRMSVLSAKTGYSGLANRNIRFYQENWTIRFGKPDPPVFPDTTY
jgi:hypothetical protein